MSGLQEISSLNNEQAVVVSTSTQARNVVQKDPVKEYDALILDAHLRQSLVSVRSLGRRGMRVAALEG